MYTIFRVFTSVYCNLFPILGKKREEDAKVLKENMSSQIEDFLKANNFTAILILLECL